MSVAVGDFTGTGVPMIAILGINDPGNGGSPGGLGIQLYTVDPSTLRATLPNNGLGQFLLTLNLPEGANARVVSASLAAGRFGNATHAQLALIYAVAGATAKIITIDFDSQGNPVQKTTFDTGVAVTDAARVVLRAGHFDWSGPFDQAAVLIGTGASNAAGSQVEIVWFDTSLNAMAGPPFGTAGFCQFDLAAGNFDRMQANPHPPPATERNPNLQVAVLGSDCASNVTATLLSVDPTNNFALSTPNTFSYTAPGVLQDASIVASDTQGRSLALGAPAKVVITHRSQPSVVLAMPPMHVDFIAPAGSSVPQVFNVSAIPNGFYTQYQTEQSNSNQSSTQSTTSWSAGAAESLTNKGVFGIPDIDSITIKNKFSAQQAWKGNSEQVHGTSSSMQFDVSQQTGFSDQLWYEESRLNLYIYPVIGQKGCPAAIPNCSASQKVPLTVQFSGVDAVSNDTVPGNTTEWYQPPWEPGGRSPRDRDGGRAVPDTGTPERLLTPVAERSGGALRARAGDHGRPRRDPLAGRPQNGPPRHCF